MNVTHRAAPSIKQFDGPGDNGIFCFKYWQAVIASGCPGQCAYCFLRVPEALKSVGGRFVLPFEFKSPHGERTSHYLIFVSKHFLGYHIMKDVMAGLSSDDGEVRSFEYIPVKSPQLPLLFELSKPRSIASLKQALLQDCAGDARSVWEIYERLSVDTPYTLKNFRDALLALESEGKITVDTPAEKRPKRKGSLTLSEKRIVTFPA